jgi:hypothetical protein
VLPTGYEPYVTSARRWYWLTQQRRTTERDEGRSSVAQALRLAQSGTTLPSTFPSRAVLLAAGVLAVEEVVGASVEELRSYGLGLTAAHHLIRFLEGFTVYTFAYGPRVGQLYEEDEVELLAPASRTSSATSDVYEVGDKGTLRLSLAITAASGTAPTLHVQIETRESYASGTWRVVDAFPVQSSTGTARRSMSGLDRFVRAVCTIGGSSPSFTFSLSGEAV